MPVRTRQRGRMMRLLPALASLALLACLLPAASFAPAVAAAADPLAAPTLLEPAPGSTATSTGVRFHWTRVDGAVSYRLTAWHAGREDSPVVSETTVNDDIVAHVSTPFGTLLWSVTPIDDQGADGTAAQSAFEPYYPAPALLGPADGAVIHYPLEAVQLRTFWQEGWPTWTYFDQDIAGSTGPTPALGVTQMPQLAEGTWRWTAGGPFWSGVSPSSPVVAPVRTLTVEWPDSTPALTSPADGSTTPAGANVALRWGSVAGAAGYEVQTDTGSGFAPLGSPVLATTNTWLLTGTFWTAQTVHWRVRATQTPPGYQWPVNGPWSGVRSFTVTEAAAPVQTTPASGAVLDAWPLLRWDPVPGAVGYAVQVADDATGTNTRQRDVLVPAISLTRPSSLEDIAAPGVSGTIWWRVRTTRIWSGVATAWSEWRQLTVAAAPGVLDAPVAGAALGPGACPAADTCTVLPGYPVLRWAPVAGAALYRVFTYGDGAVPVTPTVHDVAGPEFVQKDLNPSGGQTWWAVVACPSTADCPSSPLGSYSHFGAEIPAPALLGPAAGSSTPEASSLLEWEPVASQASPDPDVLMPAVIGYMVEFTKTKSGGGISTTSTTAAGTSLATRDVVSVLQDGDSLSWRIKAKTDTPFYTQPAAWSPARTYTRHQPVIELLTPGASETVATTLPVLSWSPTGVAGGYAVELLPIATFNLLGWISAPNWHFWTGATSVTPAFNLQPGEYVWRVSQDGGPSTEGHFTVPGAAVISILGPDAGAQVPADDVDLSWTPIDGAQEYMVAIGPTADFTWEDAVWNGNSGLPYLAVPVRLPEGPLYWRACPYLASYVVGPAQCSGTQALTPQAQASPVQLMTITEPIAGLDHLAPVSSHIVVTPRLDATLGAGGGIPVTVAWDASDADSGIASQELEVQTDAGPYAAVAGPSVDGPVRAVDTLLAPGHTYRFRTRATDVAGNVGGWTESPTVARLLQETSASWTWSRGWSRITASTASGAWVRKATTRGAWASASVSAAAIAIVAPRSATRGSAEVWIDGKRVAVIRLDASPRGGRRLVFVKTWPTTGPHRVRLVLRATAGHPRVDLDALVVLR
jgi:hypothetical protein